MPVITYRQALNEAFAEELTRDENVFLMGVEVAQYNGAYKVTKGLLDEFGPDRVVDSPITESGFAGLAVGAAMTGLRPVIDSAFPLDDIAGAFRHQQSQKHFGKICLEF